MYGIKVELQPQDITLQLDQLYATLLGDPVEASIRNKSQGEIAETVSAEIKWYYIIIISELI